MLDLTLNHGTEDMRLRLSCMECVKISLEERGPSSQIDLDSSSDAPRVEIQEDNLYKLICPHGHVSYTALQQQKFQVLFEIGAHAISDGYYREAVASFTSSLERFYEYFTKVFLYQQGRTHDEVNRFWKPMSNSSVQQVGAFSTAFNIAFNETPPLLTNNDTNFRNRVIHQGLIPSREQALSYGETIIDLMYPTLKRLPADMNQGYMQATFAHLINSFKDKEEGRTTMGIPLIIGDPDSQPYNRPDLVGAVKKFGSSK